MPAHISERRDGKFIVDTLEGKRLSDWTRRTSVEIANVDSQFEIGDVVHSPSCLRGDPEEERITGSVASHIRSEFQNFNSLVESAVEKYDIKLNSDSEINDGEIILLASPPEYSEFLIEPGDTIYSTPEGFLAEDLWYPVEFDYLIQYPESAIATGLFFDVVEINKYTLGLSFNNNATETASKEPLKTYFYHASEISDLDGLESENDLEPPVFVMIDGYDEGVYNTHLFDSSGEGSSRIYEQYRCIDSHGDSFPPYKVNKKWPYSKRDDGILLPVDQFLIDEETDPPSLFATIDHRGETKILE